MTTIRIYDTELRRDVLISVAKIKYVMPARNPGETCIVCDDAEYFTQKSLDEIEAMLNKEPHP